MAEQRRLAERVLAVLAGHGSLHTVSLVALHSHLLVLVDLAKLAEDLKRLPGV